MNKKSLSIICLILLCELTPAFSQAHVDSLKALIDVPQRDTSHIWNMMHVAWRYAFSTPDSGTMLCQEAIQLAKEVENEEMGLPYLSKAYIVQGVIYGNQGLLDSALYYNQLSTDVKRRLKDTMGIAAGLTNMGVIEQYRGNYDGALANFLEALPIREHYDNKLETAKLKHNIGAIYTAMDRHEEALLSYKGSLADMPKEALKAGEAGSSWQAIGTTFLNLEELDSAEVYLLRAKEILSQHKNLRDLASTYSSLSSLYQQQKRPLSAIEALEESIALNESINDIQGIAFDYARLGTYQSQAGRSKEAQQSFQKSLDLAKNSGFQAIESSTLKAMGEFFHGTQQYEDASTSLLAYIELSDSLRGELVSEQIAEMETRYETEKKEQKIALQQLEIENQNERNSRNILLAGAGIALLLILGGAGYLRLQERRRYEKELQEIKLKSEKERISRDLHDHVGSQLTAITTKLNMLGVKAQREDKQIDVTTIEQLDDHARETMGLLRDTIWAIKQEEIDLEGLGRKLRQYLSRYLEGMEEPRWKLEVMGNAPLRPQQGLTIFRILQEGIQNVVKHAQAKEIKLELVSLGNQLSVSLVDDGVGFNSAKNGVLGHYGLDNMLARAEEIGATLEINSAPGQGTNLQLHLKS